MDERSMDEATGRIRTAALAGLTLAGLGAVVVITNVGPFFTGLSRADGIGPGEFPPRAFWFCAGGAVLAGAGVWLLKASVLGWLVGAEGRREPPAVLASGRSCRNCGKRAPSDASYCPGCGQRLD